MPQTIDNLLATWNNAAQTFTAFKFSITDAASAAGSLLMDLQVGGSSRFSVTKAGTVTTAGTLNVGNQLVVAGAASLVSGATLQGSLSLAINTLTLRFGASEDLILGRRAAASLRLGAADAAAPVAQTLSVQSVVAGTSNTAGANLTITGSQGTGTGAGGSIVFQVAPAGTTGTAQNALASYLAINPTKGGTATTGNTVALEFPFDRNGADQTGFGVPYSGQIFFYSQGKPNARSLSSMFQLPPSAELGWNSQADFLGTSDVRLFRDAANTLALRNGANGQTQNIYGTYTDASNYRRVALAMTTAGVATLKPEGAGTGATGNVIHISGLPTSNPGPGILWNNAGTPAIGT